MPRTGGRCAFFRGSVAALTVAAVASGMLPAHASTAQTTQQLSVPALPWSVFAAGVDVVGFLLAPVTRLSAPVLEASERMPPLAPVGHALGAADTALPVIADALRLLDQVHGVRFDLGRVSQVGDPAWRVPELPDIESEVLAVSTGLAAFTDRLSDAVACECLPLGIGRRLEAVVPTAVEASTMIGVYAPIVGAYGELTGFRGPRTYLVAVGNQAEMRPSGGAPLYAAVVTADRGVLTLADKGAASTHFFPPMNRPVTWTGVDDNPYFTENPRTEPFVNAGRHPDFTVSGAELAAAFHAGGHPAVDGVIYLDLTFLQGLLALTGPVSVVGIGEVSSANLTTVLLDNAYDETRSIEDNARRQAANDRLVDALLERLPSSVYALPLLRHVGEAAEGRHLQVWFRDAATQADFDSLGWTGAVVAPRDSDWLAWYTQSGNPSKTDIQQDRWVVRDVQLDGPRAAITTDYVIANRNEPLNDPTVDQRRGYRATWMRTAVMIYLPPGATNVRVVSRDDMDLAPLPGLRSDGTVMTDAQGRSFLRLSGWIAPLDQASIRVMYELELADPLEYSLVLEPQVAFTAYEATVKANGPWGRSGVGPMPIEAQTTVNLPPK